MNEVKILNIGGSDQNIKDQYARNIIAPSENNLTAQDQPYASRDYDEGDYLIGQDRNLYKALTDIHTGDILAVNVNIKATTISDELVALEDSSVEEALEVIAYTENSSLSTRAYAVGDNLYWNYGANQGLYKVTTAIAIGDAFAIGSNIEAAEPIAKQLEVVEDTVGVMLNDLGAKNALPNNGTNQTHNDIAYTFNSDGSVTASGTASAVSAARSFYGLFTGQSGDYILSGNPIDGTSEDWTTLIVIWDVTDQRNVAVIYGLEEEECPMVNGHIYACTLQVANGKTVSTTFYPMLRPASIEDPTYAPYAKSNAELTGSSVAQDTVLGAKNLFCNELKSQTVNGYQITVNSDGSLRFVGSVPSDKQYSLFTIAGVGKISLKKGSYILSGMPLTGKGSYLRIYCNGSTAISPSMVYSTGITNEKRFEVSEDVTGLTAEVVLMKNDNLSDITISPMIRPASITDSTYVPYAMTNRELTQLSQSMTSNVATIDGSSQIIKMGRLYIGNLRFTMTSQITSGGSIITLPFNMQGSAHCSVSASAYKLDILGNSIRANETIPSGATIVASFVACV